MTILTELHRGQAMNNPKPYMQGWFDSDRLAKDKIEVKRIYIDINDGNLHDGIMFSQIIYWHGCQENGNARLRIKKDGFLWLAKTYDEWWDEARINGRTARECIKRIKNRGLIKTEVFKFNGAPTVHIRIDYEVLQAKLRQCLDLTSDVKSKSDMTSDVKSIRHEMSDGDDTRCHVHPPLGVRSLTEITTDITSETTPPSISPPKRIEEREKNFGFQIPEQEIAVRLNLETKNNSQVTSQSDESLAIVPPIENNYQTQEEQGSRGALEQNSPCQESRTAKKAPLPPCPPSYDPYFHRRRAKPNEAQWDWLPDGAWKTELGKLDDAFVMAIAERWAKEHGGTPQDKKPNVIKHFRNDPTNLPIEWEYYQDRFLHRAANLQVRKSHGIDTEAEETQLMKQMRAVTPLDDSQRVTESRAPVEVIEACADYALPTIEQTATKEMIAPVGAENASAYTKTVSREDAEFWRSRTTVSLTKKKIAVSSDELELAKSEIEALKQRILYSSARKTKPLQHSQELSISTRENSDSCLQDMRKFLRFGSPNMKDEAIAWAKDPVNGCELVVKDGAVVDIKEVDF